MDEDKLCEMFNNADLDIESKYFEMTPYKSDDSDFEWHKKQVKSSESSDEKILEETPTRRTSKHASSGSSSNLNETTKHGTKKKMTKIKHKRDNKRIETNIKKAATVTSTSSEFADVTNSTETSDNEEVKFSNFKSPVSTEKRRFSQTYGLYDSNTDDEIARQVVSKHRRLISCSNSSSETPKRRARLSVPSNQSHVYPSNWENVASSYDLNSTIPQYYGTSNYRRNDRISKKRTRWSSSQSSVDTSPVEFRKLLATETMPHYQYHQLLGDSQLLRFAEQLLGFKKYVTYSDNTRCRRLGYCVSGQKIGELAQRLLKKECKLSDKVIILIGTNDVVYNTKLEVMCKGFELILKVLRENNTQNIVVLTVPPVPKMTNDVEHWRKLKSFNDFITSCAEEGRITVIDTASLYISYDNSVKTDYFERRFGNSSKIDMIHLNRDGFRLLKAVLDINYFDKIRCDNR